MLEDTHTATCAMAPNKEKMGLDIANATTPHVINTFLLHISSLRGVCFMCWNLDPLVLTIGNAYWHKLNINQIQAPTYVVNEQRARV